MLRDVVNNHPGLLAAAGRTILTRFFRGRKKRAHLSVFAASLSSPKSFRVLTSHKVSTIRDAKFSSGNISPFTIGTELLLFTAPVLPWQPCSLGRSHKLQCMGMHRCMHRPFSPCDDAMTPTRALPADWHCLV